MIRQEVQAFAEAMEAKLKKNDWKTPWQQEDPEDLLKGLEREVDEMSEAWGSDSDTPDADVMEELIDIANYAMMIWDNLRARGGPNDPR